MLFRSPCDDFSTIVSEIHDEVFESVGRRICDGDFADYCRRLVLVVSARSERDRQESDEQEAEKLDSLFHVRYIVARMGIMTINAFSVAASVQH